MTLYSVQTQKRPNPILSPNPLRLQDCGTTFVGAKTVKSSNSKPSLSWMLLTSYNIFCWVNVCFRSHILPNNFDGSTDNVGVFRVAPQFLTTSNFIGPWYHAALLFSGLGSIVLLFVVLFSHQIREDLVRAATSPRV